MYCLISAHVCASVVQYCLVSNWCTHSYCSGIRMMLHSALHKCALTPPFCVHVIEPEEPPTTESPLSLTLEPLVSGPLVANTLTDLTLTCSASDSAGSYV